MFARLTSLSMTMLPLLLVGLDAEARAGGGGRSNGGGAAGGVATAIGLAIYAIIEIRRRKMMKKAKEDLAIAKMKDASWNEDGFKDVVGQTFHRYQEAWSKKDMESVRHLLHVDYFDKAKTLLETELAECTNVIKNQKIESMNLMSVKDVSGKEGDMFVMEVNASMIDYTIETKSGAFVESTLSREKNESDESYRRRAMNEASPFREYWVFQRSSGKWLLWEIHQSVSIVSDVMGRSEAEVMEILAREKASDSTGADGGFYKKAQ